MLEPILQQVAAGNPQIASIIGQNSDQFLQLLGEEIEDDEGALPPGAQAISVTEEERDAIERVCLLFTLLQLLVSFLTSPSFAVSVSPATQSSRRTLLAIRTRNWRRTSFSTSLTRMKSKGKSHE